jgi:hypothetical protein
MMMIRRALYSALALGALCTVTFAQVVQAVKPATPGSLGDGQSSSSALSATDRALLTAVRDNLITLAGAISAGSPSAFLFQMLDENRNLLSWGSPPTGLLQSAASVTTTAAVCDLTANTPDPALRGRQYRNAGTADICMALDTDGSPAVTCANAPMVLHPNDYMTITKDDYTGPVYCVAASGTQSLARGWVK